MKKLMPVLFACAIALASIQADAARIGGGKSMGRQSSNVTQREAAPSAPSNTAAPSQSANPSSAAAKPATTTPAPAPKRPWGAMLGGLAAGLGLAWLANSLGLGPAFANFLLIMLVAVAALIAWRMFSARKAPPTRQGGYAFQGAGGPATATAPSQYSPNNVGNDASARPWERQSAAFDTSAASAQHGSAALAGGSMIGSALGGSQSWGIPAGFDTDGFLAAAKRNFVTLQDAWDKSDITMLRSMMTDSMVGEIRTQLAEREAHTGGRPNKTEVVMLDAKLLGIEELPDVYMASVEFSGMIREDISAGPSPFREVWNMTKPVNGSSGWLVAGVQALQ
ncbi:MAG: Tim44 domain-containing protein [Proteobacteria bacterium]|nr:Tim44 domain-containing protein [Pseudomonadota bacterium]